MTEFALYVTQRGDRWDLISERCYGTPYEFERIIVANPTVPIRPILAEGIRLAIPLIERAAAVADKNLLPPWKRQ